MLVAGTASAGAAAANGGTVSANVDSIATLVISGSIVNFDFDLYNCPAGSEIIIVDWIANEPNRPDSGAAGTPPAGGSNGGQGQHPSLFPGGGGVFARE